MTRYVIRLDDAHERHHHDRWNAIEALLDKYQVKPIVAVIPDNRDLSIAHSATPDPSFWDRVRSWRDKGWAIGVHGLTHSLRDVSGKSRLPISALAEFTGLPEEEQLAMINASIAMFERQGVVPTIFVAPAHGFDSATLAALRRVRRPLILSDGFGFRPYLRYGLKTLPQQLWRGRSVPFGTWTICLHPSNMSDADFEAIEQFLAAHRGEFPEKVESLSFRRFGWLDIFVEQANLAVFVGRRMIRRLRVA